ncbi:nuclear transport factor 2 family protein [Streptomyces sp. NPDC097619]|uniref:nuclear transport factor 2 family protein n=1 Tax=Streptomyces sp. NPDC097619 TaxID=3157228 RepID=UPI0033186034
MPAPTHSDLSDPAELFRHSLRLLLDKDIAGWTALWAEDGVMEFPFAPPAWPKVLSGREAVAAYMRDYPDHIDLHEFRDLRVHRTDAEGTVIVEMRGVGRLVASGAPFDMSYIAVVTARHGRFVAYRDYWNPLAAVDSGQDLPGSTLR